MLLSHFCIIICSLYIARLGWWMWPTASFCVHQISITGKKVRSNFIRYFMQCSESVTSTINEQRHLAGRRIEYDTDTSSPILWWPIKFYGDSILLPILNGSQSIEEKRQTETYRPSAEYNQRIALLRIFMMCWLVQIKYPNINRKYATVASALDSLVFPHRYDLTELFMPCRLNDCQKSTQRHTLFICADIESLLIMLIYCSQKKKINVKGAS